MQQADSCNEAFPILPPSPKNNRTPHTQIVFQAGLGHKLPCKCHSPMPAISAIPPALSLMGPYASMARPVDRVVSIPRAARAMPSIPATAAAAHNTRTLAQTGEHQDSHGLTNSTVLLSGPCVLLSPLLCCCRKHTQTTGCRVLPVAAETAAKDWQWHLLAAAYLETTPACSQAHNVSNAPARLLAT